MSVGSGAPVESNSQVRLLAAISMSNDAPQRCPANQHHYHQRLRVEDAFNRIKHRLHLVAVSKPPQRRRSDHRRGSLDLGRQHLLALVRGRWRSCRSACLPVRGNAITCTRPASCSRSRLVLLATRQRYLPASTTPSESFTTNRRGACLTGSGSVEAARSSLFRPALTRGEPCVRRVRS